MKNCLFVCIIFGLLAACDKSEVASSKNGCHLTAFKDNLNRGGNLQYDNNGNLKRFSVADDAYLDFFYKNDQITQVKAVNMRWVNGQKLTELLTFYPTFDGQNNLSELVEVSKNPTDTTKVSTYYFVFLYDNANRINSIVGTKQTGSFLYDENGNVASQRLSDNPDRAARTWNNFKYDTNPNPFKDLGFLFGLIYSEVGGSLNLTPYMSANNFTSFTDPDLGSLTYTQQYNSRKYPTENAWQTNGIGVVTIGKTFFSYNCN